MNKLHTWKSLRLTTMLSGIFMAALQLTAGKAGAQIIAHYIGSGGTSTAVTVTANATVTPLTNSGLSISGPCSSGGYSGVINNGVTSYSIANGHVFFTVTANPGYVLNVTGYSCKLRRSNSGLQNVRMAYTIGGGVINDLADKHPDNTGCGSGASVFSWAVAGGGSLPTGVTTFTAELFPYLPVSSGGNVQFNDITINGTVTAVAPVCPASLSAGTVTPATSTVCKGTPLALTLSGASTGGTGLNFQWNSSTSPAGPFTTPVGTGTSYTAPDASNGTLYYQVTTSCGALTPVTSSTGTVTVTSPNAGAIIPLNTTVLRGATLSMDNTTYSGGIGVWSSGTTAVGDFDDVFAIPASFEASLTNVGTSLVTFTVTDGLGCTSSTSTNVNVIYDNSLALYHGANGSSTSVIGIAGETVSNIAAVNGTGGFNGGAALCTSGGLSGLTVSTLVATYSTANPYVSYTITPGPGKALRINEFHARVRQSGSGCDSARIAYRTSTIAGGAWQDEGVDHIVSSAGCGSDGAAWYFTPSASFTTTAPIEVAIFPYSPSSNSGSFQVNELEVLGVVVPTVTCTAAPLPGVITPSLTTACNSGFFSGTFAGDPGVGVTYQWDSSLDNSTWFPISGANNVFEHSSTHGTPWVTYYRVTSACPAVVGASTVSATAVFTVVPTPSAIGALPLLTVGDNTVVPASPTPAGGKWSSNYVHCVTPDSLTGQFTPHAAGVAVISYSLDGFGACTVTETVDVIYPCTEIAYLGTGGSSIAVTDFALSPTITASNLTATGFIGTPSCSFGGLSGLIVPAATTSYVHGTGPHVSFTTTPIGGVGSAMITYGDLLATVRRSNTGADLYVIEYDYPGHTVTAGPFSNDDFTCGKSDFTNFLVGGFPTDQTVTWSIYPYYNTGSPTGGTWQVNTMDIGCSGCAIPVTAIQDVTNSFDLNGHQYSPSCTIPLSCTPGGGSYSVMGGALSGANVDLSDNLNFTNTFFGGVETFQVVYTNSCGNLASVATVTVDGSLVSCDGTNKPGRTTTAVAAVNTTAVNIYPNPTSNTLNVTASEKINVTILSMDGKTVISQKNGGSIDVSKLASGLYIVKVYGQKDALIKTAKFTKE